MRIRFRIQLITSTRIWILICIWYRCGSRLTKWCGSTNLLTTLTVRAQVGYEYRDCELVSPFYRGTFVKQTGNIIIWHVYWVVLYCLVLVQIFEVAVEESTVMCCTALFYFSLSFYTVIFKPMILFEPVFQPAKFESWMRNRGDAISRSEEYRQRDIRFLWNKIQLLFPF